MEWSGISFSAGNKAILKGVTGMLEPGGITGIMGPSGCGKTSLMNVLSGRQRTSGTSSGQGLKVAVEVQGRVSCRGQTIKPHHLARTVAYVFQDNGLPSMETPRDCLNFSAFLRLPRDTSATERDALVNGMLDRLNLGSCADTIVGSATQKGLSGGEQKRTAIGVELVSNPTMVFLDEPLTGLDAYNAYMVMKSLRDLAKSGVAVMLTLHQPNSKIFDLLDDLLLLHEGEVCYQGATMNLVGYLDLLGFPCPEDQNPADKAMWVIQSEEPEVVRQVKEIWLQSGLHKDLEEKMQSAVSRSPTPLELGAEEAVSDDSSSEQEESSTSEGGSNSSDSGHGVRRRRRCCSRSKRRSTHQKGLCVTLSALLARDLRRNKRNFAVFLSTYVLFQFLISLVYSLLFWGKGRREHSNCDSTNSKSYSVTACSQELLAHFQFLRAIGCLFVNFTQPYAVESLQNERSVFLREQSGGYYGAFAYFLSRTSYELPLAALEVLAALLGTYWFVGLQGNFFQLLGNFVILSMTASSLVYIFSAACSSPAKAYAYSALPMSMQFAFSGLLVPVNKIPVAFRWLKWLCPMYYGINILGITEFAYIRSGLAQCQAEHYGSASMPGNGGLCAGWVLRHHLLKVYGIHKDEFWWPNIGMCGVLFLSLRMLAVILLYWKSRYVH